MQNLFHGVAEYLTPVLSQTAFLERGVLTPDEFVSAGDALVFQCPTWSWAPAQLPSLARSYLPVDKQFLITRNGSVYTLLIVK
jgi:ubiquitin-like-conjugating enzyme ATG3